MYVTIMFVQKKIILNIKNDAYSIIRKQVCTIFYVYTFRINELYNTDILLPPHLVLTQHVTGYNILVVFSFKFSSVEPRLSTYL